VERSPYFGNERSSSSGQQSELHTSEEDLKQLLCFYDIYIYYYYYQILLALYWQPHTSDEYYIPKRSRHTAVEFRKTMSYISETALPICHPVYVVDSFIGSVESNFTISHQ